MRKVLMATTNVGKAEVYKNTFNKCDVELLTLKDVGITTSPEENGKNVVENAVIKAKYYHELTGLAVFANDAGLQVYKLAKEDQAGLFVRRVNGVELTDEQMLENYIEKLNKVGGSSKGHFDVGLAIILENGKLYTKSFKPKIYLVNKPSPIIKKGIPLDSITYVKSAKKYKSEMTMTERNNAEKGNFKKQDKFIQNILKKKLK